MSKKRITISLDEYKMLHIRPVLFRFWEKIAQTSVHFS